MPRQSFMACRLTSSCNGGGGAERRRKTLDPAVSLSPLPDSLRADTRTSGLGAQVPVQLVGSGFVACGSPKGYGRSWTMRSTAQPEDKAVRPKPRGPGTRVVDMDSRHRRRCSRGIAQRAAISLWLESFPRQGVDGRLGLDRALRRLDGVRFAVLRPPLAGDADREFRIGPNDGPLAAEGATIKLPSSNQSSGLTGDSLISWFFQGRLFVGRNRPGGLFLGSW